LKLVRRILLALVALMVSAGALAYWKLPLTLSDNPLSWKVKKAFYLFDNWRTKRKPWLEMDYGPVIAASITVGQPDQPALDAKPGENIAYKGLAIALDKKKEASILFDTELLRYSAGWFGDKLVLTDTVYDGEFDTHPYVKGAKLFETNVAPGWGRDGSFKDPRDSPYGSLPEDWGKYRGLYVHGDKVVLSYTIGSTGVLDMPGLARSAGVEAITRTLEIEPTAKEMQLQVERVAIGEPSTYQIATLAPGSGSAKDTLVLYGGLEPYVLGVNGASDAARWDFSDKGNVRLIIPPSKSVQHLKLYLAVSSLDGDALKNFAALVRSESQVESLAAYTHGGPKRFDPTITTKGTLGTQEGPYVVDEITLPTENPWKSWMRPGDIAFFSDDRAAMTTWSGDVWIVSGVNQNLSTLKWKRYATGFAQPLGLEIVDDVVYVLGRDQITRLHDLNKDGEADYYENFNNDFLLTEHYHEFTFDLDRDRAGNFYFAKSGRHGLPAGTKHHATILKLDKEGKNLQVVCTGIRVPNGVAVGPNGEITTSDQEGHWVPTTRINLCTEGSFHGFMWGGSVPKGRTEPDKPIVWIPHNIDNSGAGQAWVDNANWGPFEGFLVHASFGRSEIFLTMMEKVDGQVQGGVVRFPLEFATGLMRPEFRPQDGQLYLCGLFGWGTRQRNMGGFYRVRYTGKPVYLPEELHVTKNGIYIGFTQPLDTASAENPANYSCSRWNYKWGPHYGSDEYKRNGEKGHETVKITSAKLQEDKRTVFLSVDDMAEVMQMQTQFRIKAADGTPLNSAIYHTVNRLSSNKGEVFLAKYPKVPPMTSHR
jgi:glucose/arabinose dehydrogenase